MRVFTAERRKAALVLLANALLGIGLLVGGVGWFIESPLITLLGAIFVGLSLLAEAAHGGR